MKSFAFDEKDLVLPGDTRLDKMLFRKAQLASEHGKSQTNTFRAGRLFRNSVSLVTLHHATNIFTSLGSDITKAGNDIAGLKLQIAEKEKTVECAIEDGFKKLFLSLSEGRIDKIVRYIIRPSSSMETRLKELDTKQNVPIHKEEEKEERNGTTSRECTAEVPVVPVPSLKIFGPLQPMVGGTTQSYIEEPTMRKEHIGFNGSYSLVSSQRLKGFEDPWPSKESLGSQESDTNECTSREGETSERELSSQSEGESWEQDVCVRTAASTVERYSGRVDCSPIIDASELIAGDPGRSYEADILPTRTKRAKHCKTRWQ